jgi:hypothetical protein
MVEALGFYVTELKVTVVFVQPVTSSVTSLDEGGQCVKLASDFLIVSVKRQSEVNYVNV